MKCPEQSVAAAPVRPSVGAGPVIPAVLHPSGFDKSDSNFYSLSIASDRRVYYTLCSHSLDHHGRIYRYDPAADQVRLLGDLGQIVGEAGAKSLPQGKSHTPMFEFEGKLYLATHYGYYAPSADREKPGEVPPGYKPYPGGHFLEYDLTTGRFADLARAPRGEGIITCNIDRNRRRLYGLTWPSGLFIYHDLGSRDIRVVGPVSRGGELGEGENYFCLCRSLAIVPETGAVYFTNPDGAILRFDPTRSAVTTLDHLNLKRDMLGPWNPHQPGHQGYNWRTILRHPHRGMFYGVHPRSGYLFEFDARTPGHERLDLIDRICAEQLRRDGRFEPFRYGYLGLDLDADADRLYYLTCDYGLTAEDGRKVENTTRLITYHLGSGRYADHGVIRLADGRYPTMPQTLARHPGGRLYSCPWIEVPGKPSADGLGQQCDLVSFSDPVGL